MIIFENTFDEDLEGAVSAFKFAQYFNPVEAVELLPTVNVLSCFSFPKYPH